MTLGRDHVSDGVCACCRGRRAGRGFRIVVFIIALIIIVVDVVVALRVGVERVEPPALGWRCSDGEHHVCRVAVAVTIEMRGTSAFGLRGGMREMKGCDVKVKVKVEMDGLRRCRQSAVVSTLAL